MGDVSSAVEALSLVVLFQDRKVCARSYALFRTIMKTVNQDGTLWLPARLAMQGAYAAPKPVVPQVGDPKELLEFLQYHLQQRANVGDQSIHHAFSALVLASNEETHRGLAAYDFSDPLFIETMVEALENKGFKLIRKSAIFMLAELDDHLFATEKAFTDPKRFVLAWSTALHEFLGDDTHQVEKAAVKVLLAIAHLPCLRVHLPKERWNLIQHFPHIMNANPPPLRRCLRDTTIVPFLKQMRPRSQFPWLGMLWMMHHHLSKEVRKQLEEETGEVVSEHGSFHLEPYLAMFNAYLEKLQARIDGLDYLDQAASDLRVRRELTVKARKRLLSIKEGG